MSRKSQQMRGFAKGSYDKDLITVSIVSHGHGQMVESLVQEILLCPEVGKIIITKNIAEEEEYPKNPRLEVIVNKSPKGYGANHNTAFASVQTPFFCVLNPDIQLKSNPFPTLLLAFAEREAGLVAPRIVDVSGQTEDSARRFPSVRNLLAKAGFGHKGTYPDRGDTLRPDWVAGMFLLIPTEVFAQVKGFDEGYFLYYEDVDLCWRLRAEGFQIIQDRKVAVIHDARRESHRKWQYTKWHLASMVRYLVRFKAW